MIEQLKTGWKIKKLGEVCEFVRGPFGGSLKKNIFRSDGYAVYEQKHAIYDRFDNVRYFIDENKFNEMKRFELNSGDLIMSCSGTIGKIAIVPENIKKGIINQALLKLSPSKKVSTVFLKLWMQSESFKDSLNEYSQGAAIKNVASVAILKNIQVPLPALPEQKRIVAILNKAFTTIAKAKANAEENLKNAKALFESYLQGVFKGEDWEEKRLVEITSLLGDGLHGTPQYTEDGEYYFINGNNLNNGIIQYKKTTQRVSIEEYHKYKKNLTDRTVLVSINGTLGNVAFYNNEKIILGKSACYFNLLEVVDKNFIKYVISSPYFWNYAHKEATGATIKNVSLKTMREFKIPIPSLKEQQTIVKKLDALSVKTKRLEAVYQKKIEDLEELKKSVLQKAFNGGL
ncbi:MAG: restriction endonuclease subunit S [Proteobacteria bacterium]|nr:restriction endonuclease subunit S [Pseudomonadota bacterium]